MSQKGKIYSLIGGGKAIDYYKVWLCPDPFPFLGSAGAIVMYERGSEKNVFFCPSLFRCLS